jgi:hypothetical protein
VKPTLAMASKAPVTIVTFFRAGLLGCNWGIGIYFFTPPSVPRMPNPKSPMRTTVRDVGFVFDCPIWVHIRHLSGESPREPLQPRFRTQLNQEPDRLVLRTSSPRRSELGPAGRSPSPLLLFAPWEMTEDLVHHHVIDDERDDLHL